MAGDAGMASFVPGAVDSTAVNTVGRPDADSDFGYQPFWWFKFIVAGLVVAGVAVAIVSWLVQPNPFGGTEAAQLWVTGLFFAATLLFPILFLIKKINDGTDD